MVDNLVEVSIGAGAAGFNFLPIFLGQRLGLFAKRGINVTVKRTGTTDKSTAALLSGELDIAITPPEGAILNYANGGPLRIIGGNLNSVPLSLIANPSITKIEELKGHSLGTSSLTEGTALYTMDILARHGLEYPGDYEFQIVGVHTARWAALQAGTLDAALQLIPLNFVGEDAGYNNLGNAWDYLPDIAFISILVNQDWASAHRDTLVAVLATIREATELMFDKVNDPLSVELAVEVTKSEPQHVQKSLDLIRDHAIISRDLTIPAAALATSVRVMQTANLIAETTAKDPLGAIDDQYRLDALALV